MKIYARHADHRIAMRFNPKKKRVPDCPNCQIQAVRDEKYDAYFCKACDLWVEPTCSDEFCTFCAHRPKKPSLVKETADA